MRASSLVQTRRANPSSSIPKGLSQLKSLARELARRGDTAALDQLLLSVLAEKPSGRTDAIAVQALDAIAAGRLEPKLAARWWPLMLDRLLAPRGRAHEAWHGGAMFSLAGVLERNPEGRARVLRHSAKLFRSASFAYRQATPSVVALVYACAVGCGNETVRAQPLDA